MNLGDISLGQVLYFHFTTRQFSTGTPITSALLAVSVYKDDDITQSTTGITTTFSSGFDGVAGLVSVKIDTSADGTFYASGHDFSIVVTGGTADGVSIIGEVVGYFSIQNRSALWAILTSTLTGIGSIGKLLVDNLDATISSRTKPADTQAAVTTVTNLTNAPTAGDFTADMKTSLNAATPSVTVSDKTGFSLTAAYDPAKTAAQAGDAMTLTAGERISIGTAVWASATRTLTSFGTLISDIWSAASRTLTAFGFSVTVGTNNDKTDYSLTAAYDPAKTAAQAGSLANVQDDVDDIQASIAGGLILTAAYDAAKTAAQAGDVMKVDTGTGANQIDITNGKVNVGKLNDAALIGTGQAGDLWRG